MSDIDQDLLDRLLETLDTDGDDRRLYCKLCKCPVSYEAARTEVGKRHQHHVSNPSGILFRIACFQQAPGCTITGDPTDDDSWFPGYRWQIACCEDCGEHLGWYFQDRRPRSFYALIEDRLTDHHR